MSIDVFARWFIKYYLPPMIANAMPVLVKGSTPIDRGALFIDGKPLLGSNKTWEGLLLGLLGAYLSGIALSVAFEDSAFLVMALGSGFAALMGDLLGAFIKRRLGIKPGDPLVPLDQLDFALSSTIFYYCLDVPEFVSNPGFVALALLLILVLHITTNYAAYLIGLKQTKL